MTTLKPNFLKVLPADIARVGANGAVLLALIRFATAIENGRDRITIDGLVWWRASHSEIAASLGLSHDAVSRCLSKLDLKGELLTCVPSDDENRTRAYAIPEQSLRGNASALNNEDAKMLEQEPISAEFDVAPQVPEQSLRDIASAVSSDYAKTREVDAISREQEKAPEQPLRENASALNSENAVSSVDAISRERTIPTKEPKEPKEGGTRKRATPIPADWAPTSRTLEVLTERIRKEQITDMDLDFEAERFRNHSIAKNTKWVDWQAAFRDWVLRQIGWRKERGAVGATNGTTNGHGKTAHERKTNTHSELYEMFGSADQKQLTFADPKELS